MNFKQRTSNQINPQLGTSNKEKKPQSKKREKGSITKKKSQYSNLLDKGHPTYGRQQFKLIFLTKINYEK